MIAFLPIHLCYFRPFPRYFTCPRNPTNPTHLLDYFSISLTSYFLLFSDPISPYFTMTVYFSRAAHLLSKLTYYVMRD